MAGASDAEKTGASQVASELGVSAPKQIVEGSEGGVFWDDLGGKAAYNTEPRAEVSFGVQVLNPWIQEKYPMLCNCGTFFHPPALNQKVKAVQTL